MKISQKMWLLIGLLVLFALGLIMLENFVLGREENFPEHVDGEFSKFRMVVRSVKYGMLFIILTFGTFFLFEVLQGLKIHPMQYLLVGIALVLFYLLLLSFAEKIPFIFSYLIAMSACLGLITWYVQFVLRSSKNVWLLCSLLVTGYTVMLVLLHSQAYTLIIGSVLMFIALAAVMYVTRNVDWYALQEERSTLSKEKYEG